MPKTEIKTMTISLSIPIELNYTLEKIVKKVRQDDPKSTCTKSSLICALISNQMMRMADEENQIEKAD